MAYPISWDAGVTFYNALIHKVALPNLRILENWPLPYRDDNRYVWAFSENLFLERGLGFFALCHVTGIDHNTLDRRMVDEICAGGLQRTP